MELKIKKGDLKQVVDLLFDLDLKRKLSRHRVRFIKILNEQIKEVEEERVLLAKEHAKKDENDEPVIKDDIYVIENRRAFSEDLAELYDEVYVVDGANNQDVLKSIKRIVLNIDDELKGKQAFIHDDLCEQFEKGAK